MGKSPILRCIFQDELKYRVLKTVTLGGGVRKG